MFGKPGRWDTGPKKHERKKNSQQKRTRPVLIFKLAPTLFDLRTCVDHPLALTHNKVPAGNVF